MAAIDHSRIPAWTWGTPVAAAVLLALKFSHVISPESAWVLVLSGLLLVATVLAAVHHAEVLALRIGEPFGSILLAVAVTAIEVALIVSILLSDAPGSEAVARDTVFAAVIIVLNGVVGLCLILGGRRHFEQTFQLQGAAAALAVLGTLATLAMVLPNFTVATLGASYSPFQLIFVGAVSLILYAVFVFVQTSLHRDYFLDSHFVDIESAPDTAHVVKPSGRVIAASAVLLLVSLTGVVLLAKVLSYPLDQAVAAAGLPKTVVGVIIAAVVLLPEGIAAVKSALANRLQNSLNLALGSALASIGLTIPTVAVASLSIGKQLTLGLTGASTVLLVLTLFVSTLTLGTGRTTVLQGAIHLVILAVFLLLAAVP